MHCYKYSIPNGISRIAARLKNVVNKKPIFEMSKVNNINKLYLNLKQINK